MSALFDLLSVPTSFLQCERVSFSPLGIQCVARIQQQFCKHCEDAHPHFCVSVWVEAALEERHQLAQKLADHWAFKKNT